MISCFKPRMDAAVVLVVAPFALIRSCRILVEFRRNGNLRRLGRPKSSLDWLSYSLIPPEKKNVQLLKSWFLCSRRGLRVPELRFAIQC